MIDRSTWIPLVAVALLLVPAATFAYLPMTDLPQHLAVVSILKHLDDPGYGFVEIYELAPFRTLYWLPYGLMFALSGLLSIEAAARVVVVASLALYPIGAIAVLRRLGRPAWLGLLTLPLVYNRSFFWGFVNLNLAIGLGLVAWALMMNARRSRLGDLALAVVSTAAALTHGYGVGMILGFLALSLIVGERRDFWRRSLPVAPAAAGFVAWALLARQVESEGVLYSPWVNRLLGFEYSVLGGYADRSEPLLLLLLILTFAVVSRGGLLIGPARWSRMTPHERTLRAFILVNLVLHFAMPTHMSTVKFVNFRHGLIATLVLPLVAGAAGMKVWPRMTKILIGLLVVATIGNSWVHLARFNAEARSFDRVAERLPARPKVARLLLDADGEVMRSQPYWHFAAFVQTRKGGFTTCSFPNVFWNIPVRVRDGVDIGPPCPWPDEFDHAEFGHLFDHVLVRAAVGTEPDLPDPFPYEPILAEGPWRLYRATGPPREPVKR